MISRMSATMVMMGIENEDTKPMDTLPLEHGESFPEGRSA